MALVEVKSASGPVPDSYDFYAEPLTFGIQLEAPVPDLPTATISVLSSTTEIGKQITLPLCKLMRISDVPQIAPGAKFLIFFSPTKLIDTSQGVGSSVKLPANGQEIPRFTIWDAFKTSLNELPSPAEGPELMPLALAQSLGSTDTMEGCRILDILEQGFTDKFGKHSPEAACPRTTVSDVEKEMLAVAPKCPPFVKFGIYEWLNCHYVDGGYRQMVQALFALKDDPEAWARSGPETGVYGQESGFIFTPSNSTSPTDGKIYPQLVPDANEWESAILNGTNPRVTLRILEMFRQFMLVGSKSSENSMVSLLHSDDEDIRLDLLLHFETIFGTSSDYDEWDPIVNAATTHDSGQADAKLKLLALENAWSKKLPALIKSMPGSLRDGVINEQKKYIVFQVAGKTYSP